MKTNFSYIRNISIGFLIGAVTMANTTIFASTSGLIGNLFENISGVYKLVGTNIKDGTVGSTQLGSNSVTSSKISDSTIVSADILDGTISGTDIANSTITSTDIATDTITAGNIAAGAVGTSEISDGTISGTDIATDTITAGNIAAGAVGTSEISDGTITSADVGAGTYGISITGNATSAGNSDTVDSIHAVSFLRNDTTNTTWNTNYIGSNKGSTSKIGSNVTYGLEAFSNDGGAAGMSFHRGGYYAVNMGLDPDNVIRIGGWSAPANLWQLDMGGNQILAGNSYATAFVDGNNTSYFIDPASNSVLNTINGGIPVTSLNVGSYAPVDNLGNHTATQNLNMNSKNIINVTCIGNCL
ncbi:MAG: hypothetical protein PHS92_04145 [Candidatus Gracilibacteria bacterium]|nr:hypothetical protein [Candidatus Gracilibacteria bacterium]